MSRHDQCDTTCIVDCGHCKGQGLPIPNVPLLRRVREHIEAHPELWHQNNWRQQTPCGTAHCFAGWIAEFDGADWLAVPGGAWVAGAAGGRVHVSTRAADVAGLTSSEASDLFYGCETLTDIDCVLDRVYARAGETP